MLASVTEGRSAPKGNKNASNTKDDNVMVCSDDAKQGNSAAYTMRRLSKDFPLIHERVLAGELSPNKAALEAGFRQPKIQLPADPAAAGRYLANRVDNKWMLACYDAYMKAQEKR